MGRRANNEQIIQFREDRKLLHYNDIIIAKRMQKARSNYSRAVNEGPITTDFLYKFYAVFGEEIKELRKTQKSVEQEQGDPGSLSQLMEALDEKYQRVIESQKNIEAGISRLEEKIAIVLSFSNSRQADEKTE